VGLRGGSGNFGIVTQFEFRLHEVGPIVLAGLALWPVERATEVLRGWRDYVDGAPDELSTACVVLVAALSPGAWTAVTARSLRSITRRHMHRSV
jgi:hypothetical protein